MKVKTVASRINVETCVKQVGNNKFDLVLIATARVRELRKQRKESEEITYISEVLLEIQEGKIDAKTYLRKVE
jgi:DNA-directed RNA polymerase omega subunit